MRLSLRNLSSLLYYDAKNHFSRTYRASIKTSIKASIRIFFCSLVVPKKGRVSINKFSGDLIRFSNKSSNEIQYGDVKIFDISSKLICTIFYSRESFESDLKKTKLMNQYFPTSEIVAVDDRKLAIYEKYVDHIEPRFFSTLDYELIQETLYNFYASYIIQQDRTGKVAHFDVKTLYNFAQLKAKYPCMEQIIELIMSPDGGMFFPHVFQHGDLSLSNILLKKDGSIVIIDWEHADYFGCFYDLHFHLLNEAIKGDFTPLEIYIRKFMNNEFELICSIVINSSAYRMGNSVIGLSLIELLMKRYRMCLCGCVPGLK